MDTRLGNSVHTWLRKCRENCAGARPKDVPAPGTERRAGISTHTIVIRVTAAVHGSCPAPRGFGGWARESPTLSSYQWVPPAAAGRHSPSPDLGPGNPVSKLSHICRLLPATLEVEGLPVTFPVKDAKIGGGIFTRNSGVCTLLRATCAARGATPSPPPGGAASGAVQREQN
eukprot:gene12957-biopygen16980